jgi:cystathionine gamma-synthase
MSVDAKQVRFQTLVVHAGHGPDPLTGAVAPPIHLSTIYARDPEGVPLGGHTYVRESNPSQSALEAALAPLEGGAHALVFASGMAAGVALLQTLPPGSRVLLPEVGYYGFRVAARDFLPQWGLQPVLVDMTRLEALEKALLEKTALVFLESPSNPLLSVVDLAAAIGLARRAGARTVVDNTFATPVLQRPLDLGADVSLHSTTKYFGGHSDVQGGALVFRERDPFYEKVEHARHVLGAVGSPFNSWLVLRGVRTLAVRMAAHSAGALEVARALARHPAVSVVHYPGLPTHPGHEIARRQMSGFGAMMSVQLKGGPAAALQAVGRARLFVRATSLGAVESLIEHRASSEGPGSTTPQDLVRLSIGLEHPADLIADLEQALA